MYIYIYIYIKYLKEYRNLSKKLCVFCKIVATHAHISTQWSHWFHIHIIFPSRFYFIIVKMLKVINKEARSTQ